MRKEKEACFTSILEGSFLLLVDWRTLKEYTAYPYGMRSWGEWADVPFNQTPSYNLNSIAHRLVLAWKYSLFFFASLSWSIVFLSFSIKQTIVDWEVWGTSHDQYYPSAYWAALQISSVNCPSHPNLLTLHEPVNIDRILVICSVGDQPPFSTEPYIFAAVHDHPVGMTCVDDCKQVEFERKKKEEEQVTPVTPTWTYSRDFVPAKWRPMVEQCGTTTGLAYFFVTRVSATASTTKGSLKTFVSWGRCMCSGSGYTDFIIPTEMPLMVTYAIIKQIKQQVHFDGQRLLFFWEAIRKRPRRRFGRTCVIPRRWNGSVIWFDRFALWRRFPLRSTSSLAACGLQGGWRCRFIFIHVQDFKYRSLQMKPEFHQIGFWDSETMFKSYVQTWQARKRLWKLDNNSRYIQNLNQVYMDFWQFQFPLSVQYSRADFGSAQNSWSQVLRSW